MMIFVERKVVTDSKARTYFLCEDKIIDYKRSMLTIIREHVIAAH